MWSDQHHQHLMWSGGAFCIAVMKLLSDSCERRASRWQHRRLNANDLHESALWSTRTYYGTHTRHWHGGTAAWRTSNEARYEPGSFPVYEGRNYE